MDHHIKRKHALPTVASSATTSSGQEGSESFPAMARSPFLG